MTTFESLAEPLVRLFLRMDAAGPTDETLRRIAALWATKRAGSLAPSQDFLAELPRDLCSHVFLAHLSRNGLQHWLVSRAGSFVSALFSVQDEMAIDAANKRCAVRLRRLFDFIAEKNEPYSAMFETKTGDGKTLLVEVFVAPIRASERAAQVILAAANSRVEQR